MKKRKNSKRLPKYALGTMKPIDLGYLPGRGIGNANATTEPGISLLPETDAMKANTIPQAINKILTYSPYLTGIAKGFNDTTPASSIKFTPEKSFVKGADAIKPGELAGATSFAATSASDAATAAATAASTGVQTGILFTPASLTAVNPLSLAKPGELGGEVAKDAVSEGIKKGVTSGGSKGGSALGGAASKALGIVGTAIGAANIGMDVADFGSHRSAADMQANMGRNFYTTDKGNQYQTYTGPNIGQELAYENAAARSKQLGFTMDTIGTGAALGSTLASFGALGSIGGPLGMGIGAGLGLLVGGLGSLLGWGDNSEEVEREAKLLADNVSMYNRQEEAVARSKDIAAEFNDRQGIGSAAEGKTPGVPMEALYKYSRGKPNSDSKPMQMLKEYTPGKANLNLNSDGTMSFSKTGSKILGQEVYGSSIKNTAAIAPGNPSEGDVLNTTMNDGDDSFVISLKNKYYPIARNIAKDQMRLDKIMNNASGSKEQQELQIREAEKMKRINTNRLVEIAQFNPAALLNNKYKCGKLPGYALGTEYLMSAMPHLYSFFTSNKAYNRAKYADMPDYPGIVDSGANTKALDILGGLRADPRAALEHIHKTHRFNKYDISRLSGLGAGGKAITMANDSIQENAEKSAVLAEADKLNKLYTANYAGALANYGKWLSEMMTNNNYQRAVFRLALNAAKENWLAGYDKNKVTAIGDLGRDLLGMFQFDRAQNYQNRMLDLYGRQVDTDRLQAMYAAQNAAEVSRFNREQAKAAKNLEDLTGKKFFTPYDSWRYPQKFKSYTSLLNPVWNIK